MRDSVGVALDQLFPVRSARLALEGTCIVARRLRSSHEVIDIAR
jgi:hypothetical protein